MKMISFFITAKSGKGALLICHQQLFDRDLENNPEVWSRTQINNQSRQAYWFIPVISAPGRLSQKDYWVQGQHDLHRKSEASLRKSDLHSKILSQEVFFFFFENQS